ncbi:uncharacterized protein BDZ83DRAFT_635347 [Colletotrichum acutatum]|uniref:BZIP domain-containing protein n=1 Tax=Glomerella acutata TaxID=27357 RepID=A0AAD8XD75_GLOAC|nr:uncharacterized protein BDZ83DRAFT_635347 [Colletotrichum acutatum]KAK1716019.1 hypothetical protein BDZ83DRAFT_635347 [Colletotrichum acutatum]
MTFFDHGVSLTDRNEASKQGVSIPKAASNFASFESPSVLTTVSLGAQEQALPCTKTSIPWQMPFYDDLDGGMCSDRDADPANRTTGASTPDLRWYSAAPHPADVFEDLLPTERASGPKRRSGRPRLSNTDSSPNPLRAAETNPVKVRTRNVRRRPSYTSASDGNNKQDAIRARNRQAAHKCRRKKQKVNEDLQTQEIAINNINKHLQYEVAKLQSEILYLKNMVLRHSGCGCRSIDEYIAQAAQNLVQGALAPKPSLLSEAAPPVKADVHASEMSWQDVTDGQCYVGWDMLDRTTCLYSALAAQSSV